MANSAADVLLDVLHDWGVDAIVGLPGDRINGFAPVIHVEYFFDHARIEDILFDGALTPRGGALQTDRSRPGFGLELKRSEAARDAV